MRIVEITNQHPDFYRLLGPFLARREVERETGARFYDDDAKTWFVALGRAGDVRGFCAARRRRDHAVYSDEYVLPEQRRRGVFRRLAARRDRCFSGPARIVATRAMAPMLEAEHAFRPTHERGRYVEMRRDQ